VKKELVPSLRVVIPSRRRIEILQRSSIHFFPYATITVAEEEMDDYTQAFPEAEIVPHPDDVVGVSPTKQWILDNFDDEAICIVDDDIYKVIGLIGIRPIEYHDPLDVLQIIQNAANVAFGTGAPIFGFTQVWADPRKFRAFDPFSFTSWTGSIIGFVGRDLRYDPKLHLRGDVDICLQALKTHRITFQDQRFSFMMRDRIGTPGGGAVTRSSERDQFEIDYLHKKWGKHLEYRLGKGQYTCSVHVRRRQKMTELKK
jgi:hypothetical protein